MIKFYMRYVKISWLNLKKDSLLLAKKIQKKNIHFDKIVAIARGGLVFSRILSDFLSLPISNIVISSYKDLKQQKEPEVIEESTASFSDQTILIVDDVSDTGKTFLRALSHFKNKNVKKIYTASPYIKPKTSFIPDFWVKNIDAWIVFPYDIKETYEAFLKNLGDSKKAKELMKKIGFKKNELKFI